MTNFIFLLVAAKIVIKSGCFWYLWTTKNHNIYLLSSYSIQVGYQLHFLDLAIVRAQSAPPHVVTYLPELM